MKEMQAAGYRPTLHCLYRSPQMQADAKSRGASNAGPFQSGHQYYGAADIVDEKWYWFAQDEAPPGHDFWECLWDCVQLVSEKYDVRFKSRLPWDLAHVELESVDDFRTRIGKREPTRVELDQWFAQELPKVWKQYQASKAAS